MFKKKIFLIVFLYSLQSVCQDGNNIEYHKKQFFLLQNSPDSALVYVNKIFNSKKPVDLAFAYTTKRYLLNRMGKTFDESHFNFNINKYLKQVEETKSNYTDLGNIYNILGHTELNKNNLDTSLKNYTKAKEFAKKNKDYFQLAKIEVSIAINLTSLNFLDKAIIVSKEVNDLLPKLKYNSDNYDLINKYNTNTLGYIYFKKFNENTTENKKYSDSALVQFNKIFSESNDKIYLAQASFYLGLIYNSNKDYDKANIFLLKSKELYDELNFKNFSSNAEFNYYYNNFKKGDYKIAKQGFLKVIKNQTDSSVNFNYLFSHKYLSKIYIKENRNDSIEYYYDKFLSLYEKTTEKEKIEFSEAYKTLENSELKDEINQVMIENSSLRIDKKLILFLLTITVILAFVIFYNLNNKKKKQEEMFQEIIKQYNNEEYKEEKDIELKKAFIPDVQELKILEGLKDIETKEFFLDKNFSLYNAAKKMGTNTSYLSNVINNNNKMTFNDYTNNLRINYIVKKLIEDKKIRNYTNQALAEMGGYKNGASFARIFKEKTGVSPILFINKLNSTKDI